MPARKKSPAPVDFEKNLLELEQLVAKLEKGELSLEDSLKEFERGIELTRTCQQALANAQQKIEILTEKDGKTELEPYIDDSTTNAPD